MSSESRAVITHLCGEINRRHQRDQRHRADNRDGRSTGASRTAKEFGGPLDATNVYRSLQQALTAHNIRRVGLHQLRHSAASIMLDQDLPLKVVQEFLGHRSLMLTADTYSHVTPKLQREAAEKLNAIFDKKKPKDRELD